MVSNPDHPLVSVCIPVFNGENFITEAINSVITQSYTNFELIIVDNCSTDLTQKIVHEFHDRRIRYIKNGTNIGSIKNFNKCIEVASGEYFLLLPHDDLLLPEALKIFTDRLKDPDVGLAYSSIHVIDKEGCEIRRTVNHLDNQLFSCEETISDIVNFFVPIQLAMTRTILLKDLGGFNSHYGPFCDIHLWLRIIFKGWKSFYNSEALSSHREHSQQGQRAFLESDITIAGEHWGKRLDRKFWIENSYNVFFLRLTKFIKEGLVNKSLNSTSINNLMLKKFIHSHLRFLTLAIFNLNKFVLWQEILLFGSVKKTYGLLKLIYYYPLILLHAIEKKIVNKSKNLAKSFS